MSHNYVVTAHKATVVSSSVTGNFTGPDDLNLIQAKGSGLVVSLATPEGLKPILDLDVFGRVHCVQLFRPKVMMALKIKFTQLKRDNTCMYL